MAKAYTLRRLVASVFAAWALVVGSSAGVAAQSRTDAALSKPLINSQIVEAERTPLTGSTSPLARAMTDLSVAPADLQLNKMILTLKRSSEKQAALERILSEQQNAQSANYHQWLTPERFGQLYGADEQDIATITNWLVSHGFTVESVAPGRNAIIFSGSNAQLQEAFQTSMHVVADKAGAHHYASLSTPTIPEALAPAVSGFARLNNIPLQAQHTDYGRVKYSKSTGQWEDASASKLKPELNVTYNGRTRRAVSPYDWATIYNVLPLWNAGIDGTGQSIAVVAKSDINVDDVASFRKSFGLPVKPVQILYAGPKPGITSSEGEAALDAQWSGAIAPQASIYVITSDDTATTDGLYLDFYYAIENNVAPVLSVSWGVCELGLSLSENDYVNSLWQQAAAEGITVIVSTGDSGSAGCDQGNSYAYYGTQVNALASTPYNVAVGGTDLYGTYTNTSSFWAASNDSKTMASALSYIPEIPWNDSCGNPQLLAAYQNLGYSLASAEALCNSSTLGSSVRNTAGGSGGPSHCTNNTYISSTNFTCKNGYSKPSWQAGVTGIPSDNARDIPDISFFAGDGLWGSYNVYCTSDVSPDGTCDFSNGADVQYMAAGGTSFAAPAFAGVAALLNQKHGNRQGQIAPMLYKLATLQYSTPSGLSNCNGSTNTNDNTCIFHDITLGSNAVPCYKGYGGCTVATSGYSYGILSGYSSTNGYDMSSGIGSANVANLVNKWESATNFYLGSTTSLTLSTNSVVYGQAAGGTITVAAAAGVTGQPAGDTSILTGGFSNGPFTLTSGTAAMSILGLSAGTHSLVAHYAGNESFAASDSAPVNVTIAKASTTLGLTSSRTSLTAGDTTTLIATIQSTSTAAAPTGSVIFVNKTTGVTLGSVALADTSSTTASGKATLNLSGAQLTGGANQIVATYAGDGNYAAASAASVSFTYQLPFTLSTTSTALSIPANGFASFKLTLSTNGTTLSKDVTFACPQSLPAGLSCAFSPAIAPAGSGTATTTLTVYSSAALLSASNSSPKQQNLLTGAAPLLLGGLFGLGLLGLRRARWVSLMVIGCIALSALGCGSDNSLRNTIVTLKASADSVAVKSPISYTAAVAASKASSDAPSGQVSFYDAGTLLSTIQLTSGAATLSNPSLAVGDHPITAVYSGDSKYDKSSASLHTDVTYSYNLVITASNSDGISSTVTMPVTVQ